MGQNINSCDTICVKGKDNIYFKKCKKKKKT